MHKWIWGDPEWNEEGCVLYVVAVAMIVLLFILFKVMGLSTEVFSLCSYGLLLLAMIVYLLLP